MTRATPGRRGAEREAAAAAIERRAGQWAGRGGEPDQAELIGLIRTAARVVIAGSEALLSERGMNRGQVDVLLALYRAGESPLTQAQLAGAMLITPAGMKKRIDALVHAGLLLRVPDTDDSRKQRLGLTETGSQFVVDLLGEFFRAESVALSALDRGEREALRSLLRKLVDG